MKVLHFILGRADQNTSNGVNKVIFGHAKYGNAIGHDVQVVGVSSSQKTKYELIERDGFCVHSFNSFLFGAFDYIRKVSTKVDIIHIHSVWNNYNVLLANYLILRNIPYVITPHSGLTDDRIKQSNYIFKLLYHKLFQKRVFNNALGVHALTQEESTVLSKYTLNKKIFVVENGIELTDRVKKNFIPKKHYRIGFLGRLAIEKNILGLLHALKEISPEILKRVELVLIGPCKNKDFEKFKSFIKENDLQSNVSFEGALYGKEKENMLAGLDGYIHPAFSDVVSIAVMEALSFGLPSIITRTSDVSYYYNSNSFIMVEPYPTSIAKGIERFVLMEGEHETMSNNSIDLVHSTFNWPVVIPKLYYKYNDLLN